MTLKKAQKDALIKVAVARAAAMKQRWTEIRAQVYDALLDCGQPVSAYDLLEKVAKARHRDVSPMSVYRALDALIMMGLAVKIESMNTFVACQHTDHEHQHVLMVCDKCGTTDEVSDTHIARKLKNDAHSRGFTTTRHILELHGICRECHTTPS